MVRPRAVRATVFFAGFVAMTLGGCSASWRDEPRPIASSRHAHEDSEDSEDEILSAPYGDEDGHGSETTEEKAGGMMVAVLFVGMILAAAVAPLLLLGL